MNWPVQAITEAVLPTLPGFTLEVLAEVDSTNSELLRRVRRGCVEPLLLVAQQQHAGRGRLGREWHSAAGALAFSLGLPMEPALWSGLSLAVGLSVAAALHPRLRLKWPNDIWLDKRKMAGILIETANFNQTRYAVIGVGINVAAIDSGGWSTPAAWLTELVPDMDAATALQRVVPPMALAIKRFETQGFAPFRAQFESLDALAGCSIRLVDGTEGIAGGVDRDGALQVHTVSGTRIITSSEVSVRPAG